MFVLWFETNISIIILTVKVTPAFVIEECILYCNRLHKANKVWRTILFILQIQFWEPYGLSTATKLNTIRAHKICYEAFTEHQATDKLCTKRNKLSISPKAAHYTNA